MSKFLTFVLLVTLVAASTSTGSAPAPQISEELVKEMLFQSTAIMRMYFQAVQDLGQVKSLEELQAEGWIPYRLVNLVTGAPMRNVCDRDSPGDYCLKIGSSTRVDQFYFHVFQDRNDSSGRFEIHRRFRETPFWRFPGARQHHYTPMDLKLLSLGRAVAWVVWQGASERVFKDSDKPAIDSLHREPARQLIDPRNGAILEFDGRGYGSLVRVDQIHPGLALIRVIEGNEIVYAATVAAGEFIPPVFRADIPPADGPANTGVTGTKGPFKRPPSATPVVSLIWPAVAEGDPLSRFEYADLLRPYFSGYTFRSR